MTLWYPTEQLSQLGITKPALGTRHAAGAVFEWAQPRWLSFNMRTAHLKTPARLLAAFLAVCPPALAEVVLYEGGFEGPGFSANQKVAGQDGWVAAFDQNVNAANITTERARGGTQSVKIVGAVMGLYRGRDYYAGFYQRAVSFDPITSSTPIVEFSVDAFYVPGQGGWGARAQVELLDSSDNFIGAFSVDADGTVLAFNEQSPMVQTTCDISVWNSFSTTINYVDRTVEFRVNGVAFGTVVLDPVVLDYREAALSLVHNGAPNNHVVYFDNYRVTARSEFPKLSIHRDGDTIVITFDGSLESTGAVDGTWAEVPGNPASPLRIPATSQAAMAFYRARK